MAISKQEALEAFIAESRESEDEGKSTEVISAERLSVEVSGRRRYFDLRDTWSRWIIWWITLLIIFNVVITTLVGLAWLDYSQYEWFITAVIVQTFLQIVGLGAVAVAYLFKDN